MGFAQNLIDEISKEQNHNSNFEGCRESKRSKPLSSRDRFTLNPLQIQYKFFNGLEILRVIPKAVSNE
jgi:hypothetical protein